MFWCAVSLFIIWPAPWAGKMNQILRCDWLPEWARWSCLAHLGLSHCVPQEKFPRKPYNKSFIDQACSVKMAGYWPCSFFACFWTSTPSRSINTQKKNLANIQPSWAHTWLITHTYFYLLFAFWLAIQACQNTAQLVKIYSDTTHRNI